MKTYLEQRHYSKTSWNEEIMPLVADGTLKEIPNENPGFLMAWQTFNGMLMDTDGRVFRCVGWTFPGGPAYVDVMLAGDRPNRPISVL